METFDSQQQMRDSLFRHLSDLDAAVPPEFLTSKQTSSADAAPLEYLWHSSNLKERILVLRSLIRYDVQHIGTDHIVKLLSSVHLGKPTDDNHLQGLHGSVLHLHSALLLKWLQLSSPERYY